MSYPEKATIIEVGPRDGLQNEPIFVPTVHKIKLINLLSKTGLKNIEVTSFVSPKAIPQLVDHDEVFTSIDQPPGIIYSALVPNEKGMRNALTVGLKHIAIFTAASEQFNQRNIRCSIKESIERFIPVIELAKEHGIPVRAYVSCVLGCPYEGNIAPEQVLRVVEQLTAFDINEISLGDTIGVGTPKQTIALIEVLGKVCALSRIAMHFHDTFGQAIANIHAALQHGITRFDSAVAGLGGCPYARGASGNVATEDVLYLMNGLGIETGVDIFKVVEAGDMICKILSRQNQSKVANALLANPNQPL